MKSNISQILRNIKAGEKFKTNGNNLYWNNGFYNDQCYPVSEKNARELIKEVLIINEWQENFNYFKSKMETMTEEKLGHQAGTILLRESDQIALMGKDKYDAYKQAFKVVLDGLKGTEVYNYFYHLEDQPHGFCTFERWKLGLLF